MSFADKRIELIALTKKQLQDAVTPDNFIIQSLASIDDLTVQLNHLSKRVREWAAYAVPEAEHRLKDHEHFLSVLTEKHQADIISEFSTNGTMGATLTEHDWSVLVSFASSVKALYVAKQNLLDYLEALLKEHTPNLQALLGTTIAARILASAGGRRRLIMLPSSTIQLLGAEKALFRHLKTGAKSPKHGYIVNHQLIQQASRQNRGKVARALADKAALCAKLDYFGGEFLADTYLKDLEAKFL